MRLTLMNLSMSERLAWSYEPTKRKPGSSSEGKADIVLSFGQPSGAGAWPQMPQISPSSYLHTEHTTCSTARGAW